MNNPAFAAVPIASVYPLAGKFSSFGDLFSVLLKNIFTFAGLIFFFVLIFAGLQYILSGGNKENLQKAGASITNALLGLIIVFVSYWIIKIIQILTGVKILNN